MDRRVRPPASGGCAQKEAVTDLVCFLRIATDLVCFLRIALYFRLKQTQVRGQPLLLHRKADNCPHHAIATAALCQAERLQMLNGLQGSAGGTSGMRPSSTTSPAGRRPANLRAPTTLTATCRCRQPCPPRRETPAPAQGRSSGVFRAVSVSVHVPRERVRTTAWALA